MSQCLLSVHSFACEANGHAIFLDLKRDRYTTLGPEDLRSLRANVRGWQATGPLQNPAEDSEGDRETVDALLAAKLLTHDASIGKDAKPVHLDTPTATFLAPPRPWPRLTASLVRDFIAAWVVTTLMMRATPIRVIVKRVQRRKEQEARRARVLDIDAVRQLMAVHFVLQPVFYEAKDACLRNSLTMIEFLARHHVYPTLAFGVKAQPFSAHCWVQEGSTLLSDPIDHVRTFTPIMVI